MRDYLILTLGAGFVLALNEIEKGKSQQRLSLLIQQLKNFPGDISINRRIFYIRYNEKEKTMNNRNIRRLGCLAILMQPSLLLYLMFVKLFNFRRK